MIVVIPLPPFVSIEPLWNGNWLTIRGFVEITTPRLNRTIVEWKYLPLNTRHPQISFLRSQSNHSGMEIVLLDKALYKRELVSIEPLWNGNSRVPNRWVLPSLNRTIVEWKL
jgi:hypothetical protein